MLIQDKLLSLTKAQNLPIIRVVIDPPNPNRRIIPKLHWTYQFWKDDKFCYSYYFEDNRWYTNTRCSDATSHAIMDILESNFPEGINMKKNFSVSSLKLTQDQENIVNNLLNALVAYIDEFDKPEIQKQLTESGGVTPHVAKELHDNIKRALGIKGKDYGSDMCCFSKRNRITKCFSDIYTIPNCSLHDWSVRNPDTTSHQADANLPIELIQEVKDAGFECEPSGFVTDDKDPNKGYTILIVARKYEPDGEYERMEEVMTDLLVKHGFDKNAISTTKWD